MTRNQLDVIIDKKPIRALVDSGASFSVISDNYRRFLKKVLFADAKSVMLKVADGNFVRPIGKCVLRVRINNRELPFEFIVLSHCSHDVILGWDFLEASQAVIDCGQNELVLEDICRDSTAPDAWNLYATRDYTLKPHSLTRITVSGYQTRGDINVVLDGSKHLLFEKNIATPSMVSTYRNGKSDVWVTNLQFRNQIIPRGMCIGQAEPLNEGHLCVISDTSGCLDAYAFRKYDPLHCVAINKIAPTALECHKMTLTMFETVEFLQAFEFFQKRKMSDLSYFQSGQIIGYRLGGPSLTETPQLLDVSKGTMSKVPTAYT
ncbi:transposon Ty3-I Gag-Pol polyprotein [Trichonephila clavipes]|nr:transposon Ty3-I Gag-Pol polyprotein [Trichonephila clavipes]